MSKFKKKMLAKIANIETRLDSIEQVVADLTDPNKKILQKLDTGSDIGINPFFKDITKADLEEIKKMEVGSPIFRICPYCKDIISSVKGTEVRDDHEVVMGWIFTCPHCKKKHFEKLHDYNKPINRDFFDDGNKNIEIFLDGEKVDE